MDAASVTLRGDDMGQETSVFWGDNASYRRSRRNLGTVSLSHPFAIRTVVYEELSLGRGSWWKPESWFHRQSSPPPSLPSFDACCQQPYYSQPSPFTGGNVTFFLEFHRQETKFTQYPTNSLNMKTERICSMLAGSWEAALSSWQGRSSLSPTWHLGMWHLQNAWVSTLRSWEERLPAGRACRALPAVTSSW